MDLDELGRLAEAPLDSRRSDPGDHVEVSASGIGIQAQIQAAGFALPDFLQGQAGYHCGIVGAESRRG